MFTIIKCDNVATCCGVSATRAGGDLLFEYNTITTENENTFLACDVYSNCSHSTSITATTTSRQSCFVLFC